MKKSQMEKTVFISGAQINTLVTGCVYGRYYKESGIFNVFPSELKDRGELLGKILPTGAGCNRNKLCGVITDTGIDFYSYGKKIKCEVYDLYQNIFSRNEGILESDVMEQKRVVISGCGSVGSLTALELARAGAGHFILVDADILEYHNVCRHQCGIDDAGDFKVNALKRKIFNINPSAEVITFTGIIQNLPKNTLDSFCNGDNTVFIGCADNRIADVYTNRISIYYKSSFISIGFWERAFAGEIFYHMYGKGMPCYACALGDGSGLSARAEANHHMYSNQEDAEKIKFEPGISIDINFVTSIGVKLVLDILNAGNDGYIPRLLNDFRQYTLICNTSDPRIGGEMVEIFSYPLQVTRSLKVVFSKKCGNKCKYEDVSHG